MSFAVSLDGGALEYSGSGLGGLFAQPSNILRPRFWNMLAGLLRFYHDAKRDSSRLLDSQLSLGEYLAQGGYGEPLIRDHLLPMASAIWSAAPEEILKYPASAFLRFNHNHGLLLVSRATGLGNRGRRQPNLRAAPDGFLRRADPARCRGPQRTAWTGRRQRCGFARAVVKRSTTSSWRATPIGLSPRSPTQAMKNGSLLGAFRYSRNVAVLHTDETFMPKRRRVWSSWNFLGLTDSDRVCVTYWMNRLQGIESERPLLVTLNPARRQERGPSCTQNPITTPFLMGRRHGRSSNCGRCKGKGTRGSVALISAPVFTRTVCRRGWLLPNSSAACAGLGASQTSPGE